MTKKSLLSFWLKGIVWISKNFPVSGSTLSTLVNYIFGPWMALMITVFS